MAFAQKRASHDSMLSVSKTTVKSTTRMSCCRERAATGDTGTTVWMQREYQNMFKKGEGTHTKTRE